MFKACTVYQILFQLDELEAVVTHKTQSQVKML